MPARSHGEHVPKGASLSFQLGEVRSRTPDSSLSPASSMTGRSIDGTNVAILLLWARRTLLKFCPPLAMPRKSCAHTCESPSRPRYRSTPGFGIAPAQSGCCLRHRGRRYSPARAIARQAEAGKTGYAAASADADLHAARTRPRPVSTSTAGQTYRHLIGALSLPQRQGSTFVQGRG